MKHFILYWFLVLISFVSGYFLAVIISPILLIKDQNEVLLFSFTISVFIFLIGLFFVDTYK